MAFTEFRKCRDIYGMYTISINSSYWLITAVLILVIDIDPNFHFDGSSVIQSFILNIN